MRTTSKIPLRVGGAIVVTYDSQHKEFEASLGESLLDDGNLPQ